MIKMVTWLSAVLLVIGITALAPPSARADGNANFMLGMKQLDEDDWAPVEDQALLGAEVDFGAKEWPVHLAIDYMVSVGVEDLIPGDVTGMTAELDVGVRKVWEKGGARPYLGGGIGVITGSLEVDTGFGTVDDDDTALGIWIGGGIFWRLGSRFNIGLSARYSQASVDLFGVEVEAGGPAFGMLLGWGWPASK